MTTAIGRSRRNGLPKQGRIEIPRVRPSRTEADEIFCFCPLKMLDSNAELAAISLYSKVHFSILFRRLLSPQLVQLWLSIDPGGG